MEYTTSDKSLNLPLLFGWEILTLAAPTVPTSPASPWPTVSCNLLVQLQLSTRLFFSNKVLPQLRYSRYSRSSRYSRYSHCSYYSYYSYYSHYSYDSYDSYYSYYD